MGKKRRGVKGLRHGAGQFAPEALAAEVQAEPALGETAAGAEAKEPQSSRRELFRSLSGKVTLRTIAGVLGGVAGIVSSVGGGPMADTAEDAGLALGRANAAAPGLPFMADATPLDAGAAGPDAGAVGQGPSQTDVEYAGGKEAANLRREVEPQGLQD